MAHMNVLKGSEFSMVSLTNALEFVPYVPRRLGQMNLFSARPIRTTGFTVEEQTDILTIIPTSERGSELDEKPKNPDRVMRYLETPRLAQKDRLTAAELQDIRAFGTESELQMVQAEILRRVGSEDGTTGMRANLEITREHHRLGAIQGLVLDADGTTVLYDWFNVFGITQEPFVDFAWATTVADEGIIRQLANQITRTMARNAKGAWIDGQTRIHAICGDNFYDRLTQNKETRNTYLQTGQLGNLTADFGAFETFRYGGITWENYRGTDDNSTIAIPTDECRFFPVGGSSIFQAVQSPGEFFPYVNQPGQAEYLLQIPDLKRDAYVDFELYAYPAYMCTRPKMLMRGRTI